GEDPDAFHYVGYAESSDLATWTVRNGLGRPLLSIDTATDSDRADWYAGRVYAPAVTVGADGCSATMIFAGYATTKPKDSLNDYRQIGVVTLSSCADAGAPISGQLGDAGAARDPGGSGAGGAAGPVGGSDEGGCS